MKKGEIRRVCAMIVLSRMRNTLATKRDNVVKVVVSLHYWVTSSSFCT